MPDGTYAGIVLSLAVLVTAGNVIVLLRRVEEQEHQLRILTRRVFNLEGRRSRAYYQAASELEAEDAAAGVERAR